MITAGQIADAGYQYARTEIAAWLAGLASARRKES